MSSPCFFYQTFQKKADQVFIHGNACYTYRNFEQYVQQLEQLLTPFKPQTPIALATHEPLFCMAMAVAAFRKRLIVFFINHRLPKQEQLNWVSKSSCAHFFDEPISINTNFSLIHSHNPSINLSQISTYLLTSGSSHTPKICQHTLHQHLCSADGSNAHLNYTEKDTWLLNLPLYHVSGLSIMFRTILAHASIYLPKSKDFYFEKTPITFASCVHSQLNSWIKKRQNFNQLKCLLHGGAPLSSYLKEKAKEQHLPLYETYGLTEMCSQVATSTSALGPMQPLPHVELKIEQDEIWVKGKSLFSGYLNQSSPLNSKGYFATQDLGALNGNNLLVTGRRDNLFISGGENIQPEEIERHLSSIKGIEEAIVCPKKDEDFGYVPVAYIKVNDQFDATSLVSILSQKLPKYKIPKTYLPLSYSSLKPSRKHLSEL